MKLLFVFLVLALGGCQSVEEAKLQKSVSEKITRQIIEFTAADANAVVAGRLKEGNINFLGFAGTPTDPTFVPGLKPEEIRELTDAKLYQWELFYYYHGRSSLGSAEEEKALWNARVNYAERVNRRLLEEIRKQIPKK